MEQKKYFLTESGIKKLKDELEILIEVKRPEIIKAIKEAREQGDLSENADYDAAKNTQGEIEKRIKEIQDILNYAEIINEDKTSLTKVKVGSKVTIFDFSDKHNYTYEIVGEIEADPNQNKISNLSPLAKVILDKPVNSVVEVHGVEEPYKIKIVKIQHN
jgi:transcription elongation factor GreA